jgi:hypothetical protein
MRENEYQAIVTDLVAAFPGLAIPEDDANENYDLEVSGADLVEWLCWRIDQARGPIKRRLTKIAVENLTAFDDEE